MKEGLREFLGNGVRFFSSASASVYIGLRSTADPASNININLLTSLPASGTEALTIDASGNMGRQALGGGGTVTSVALTAPSWLAVTGSPITTSGTLAIAAATGQTANQFLATPNGSTGAVSLRALVYADLSALVGTGSNTLAAGNDSRLHTQHTDTGTTQTSFALDSGGTGVRLKNNGGALQLRNLADSANADLIVGNLTVAGTTTTVNSETVTIDDNIIVLNNNVSSGTPTEDGGVQIRRGASTNAALIWDETNDLWKAGLAGAELAVTRTYRTTFTNATLSAGVLTLTHSLGNKIVNVQISDNSDLVLVPDNITLTNITTCSVDLTSFSAIAGTWNAIVTG